jgi:hypothetical protein
VTEADSSPSSSTATPLSDLQGLNDEPDRSRGSQGVALKVSAEDARDREHCESMIWFARDRAADPR